VASVVCSFYIFSACKLLKARKAVKEIARRPSIVMVAPQPQYAVSQALPVYGSSIYPNLAPTGAQA
jgi:hypothetical protein